ncbi:hypothetical protein ACFSUK_10390 [Sphingobium scionense]
MNYAKADMLLPTTVDVISLNYQGAGIRGIVGQYPAFRAKFPDKLILSTESASALSSRGEYMFPVAGAISGPVRPWSGGNPDTHQVSAYEMHAADFGSSPDRVWAADDQNPYVAGEFVWTGFDYLGEPTPITRRAAAIPASSISPVSPRTASGSTRRAGARTSNSRISCRTGPGPIASARSRRSMSFPR